ncbi:MAG: hypothetical protein ACPGSI_18965 [Pikeienuella sp.]
MRQAIKWFDWAAVLWLATFLVFTASWALFPASFWFEVRRVEVLQQTTPDGFNLLAVDREIHRPFLGTWHATVRSLPGNTVVCQGSGGTTYRPGSDLPQPLNMGWWIDDPDCRTGGALRAGEYYLSTTWTVQNPWGILPDRKITIDSNVFSVGEGQ